MKLGRLAILSAAMVGLVLAIMLPLRLSTDALALLVGVVAGWATGLPAYVCLFRAVPRRSAPNAGPAATLRLTSRDFIEIDSGTIDPRQAIVLGQRQS